LARIDLEPGRGTTKPVIEGTCHCAWTSRFL